MALNTAELPIGSSRPLLELVAARPVLSPKGQAALALIRFLDTWSRLGAFDRRYFADELAALAEEARGS